MTKPFCARLTAAVCAFALFEFGGGLTAFAQSDLSDVTQPGDPILASSANSPGSEGVAAILILIWPGFR
jgi:hypothetical protein